MSRRKSWLWVVGLAVSLMAVPVWAKGLRASLSTDPAMIAGTHLKAGQYDFVVQGNRLKVLDDNSGKLVAEAKGTLMQSNNKPRSDELILDHQRIEEVHFANKTQYFKVKS